jgi:hypothetical protein
MTPLDLVRLTGLMKRTKGGPALTLGLIDGPVVAPHPDLADEHRLETPGRIPGGCTRASSAACVHGTFVAGILCARRGSIAPAICPDCTLLARPIFAEGRSAAGEMPSATPDELAQAILDCLDGGARRVDVISVARWHAGQEGDRHASRRSPPVASPPSASPDSPPGISNREEMGLGDV